VGWIASGCVYAGRASHLSKYIPEIDGLRAVAILIVVLSHFTGGHLIPGGLGVTLFFFISGYLITNILAAELETTGTIAIGAFYVRRFRRLAPALLAMIAVVSIWYQVSRGAVVPQQITAAVLYYMNYYTLAGGDLSMPLGVLWSLAVEEHYYLIFPLLLLLGWRNKYRMFFILAAACVAVLCWRTVLVLGFHASEYRTFMATDTRIDSILFGALLAILPFTTMKSLASYVDRPVVLVSATGLLLASLLIRSDAFRETLRYTLQGIAFIPIFYAIRFSTRLVFVKRALSFPPSVWLGKISYSLYLWHFPVLFFLGERSVILAAIMSVALAAASFYFVESPLRRRREKKPLLNTA
jgi:peptidoglycan/LPS O-acetylase OafA/YrhL